MRMCNILGSPRVFAKCNSIFVWLAAKAFESSPLLAGSADPCTSAANQSVQQVLKGKCSKYYHCDVGVHTMIAKHAC